MFILGQFTSKVFRGKETERHTIPYQAGLYNRNINNSISKTDPDTGPFCGASVLTENYLITAAHCFDPPNSVTEDLYVMLGDYDTTKKEAGQMQFNISLYFKHPQYNVTKDGIQVNDIAIIKLSKPAIFSPIIGHICLPETPGVYFV